MGLLRPIYWWKKIMTIYNMLLVGGSYTPPVPNFYSANRRRTLMLLGDSITWGWNVFQYQTYAKAMQEKIDTVVAGGANTDEWVARNVQADDIISRDSVATKLQNGVGLSYDNIGPFESSYVTDGFVVNPAILMNAPGDEFSVTPSSLQNPVRYLTVMVKVTGSGTNSATIEAPGLTPLTGTVATIGGSNIGATNIYRFIYDTGSSSTSFTIRRVAATPPATDGDAVARILSVNPTNLYPSSGVGNFGTTGYINVQINARGSYVFSDYSNDMSSIHESVIFPLTDTATLIAVPVYVIALGTVNMYFGSPTPSPGAGDRRVSPATYGTQLDALVGAIQTVSPTSPIVLTYPPIPNTSLWFTLDGTTREEYDSQILSVVNSRSLPVVDLRPTLTTTDYQTDGLHPNAIGQGKLGTAYINGLGL